MLTATSAVRPWASLASSLEPPSSSDRVIVSTASCDADLEDDAPASRCNGVSPFFESLDAGASGSLLIALMTRLASSARTATDIRPFIAAI